MIRDLQVILQLQCDVMKTSLIKFFKVEAEAGRRYIFLKWVLKESTINEF